MEVSQAICIGRYHFSDLCYNLNPRLKKGFIRMIKSLAEDCEAVICCGLKIKIKKKRERDLDPALFTFIIIIFLF